MGLLSFLRKAVSVPQGVIGLMTRMGMGCSGSSGEFHEVMPEVEEVAKKNVARSPAVPSAYPTTWLTHSRMLISFIQRAGSICGYERTNLYAGGDSDGIKALEKRRWLRTQSTKTGAVQKLMKTTKDGKALYLLSAC